MSDGIQSEIDRHVEILRKLQTSSGLFLAAAETGVTTGYDKSWLRDNFYEVMAFEAIQDWETSTQTWHALLDVFCKHADKIDWAAKHRPRFTYQYIHARYNPETFEEYWDEWGNKQNDAVGCILFAIGERELLGKSVLRNDDDRNIVKLLVTYLSTLEYWSDPDNGVWEEYEEVHASSIGACVAGLTKIKEAGLAEVSDEVIQKGHDALAALLPRESKTKFADLALLSLLFPYRVVSEEQQKEILKNIEYHLDRDRGVIRYKSDRYYNANEDEVSEEAEWTMGLSWLSIIYREMGDIERADHWLDKARRSMDNEGKFPELYFSNSTITNENNPLGWSESLYIVALQKKLQK